MSQLFRVVINWTGFAGAPGFTNLHFYTSSEASVTLTDAQDAVDKVDDWLTALRDFLPTNVHFKCDAEVAEINEATGDLIGFLTTTPEADRAGTDAAGYSAASGACVAWSTPSVKNGRRIRGRTFIVPLGGNAYDGLGTINDAKLTTMRTATAALLAADSLSSLRVYSRATVADPDSGMAAVVSSFKINDKAAILTSRRD